MRWTGRPYADVCSMTSGKYIFCVEYDAKDSRGDYMTHAIAVDCDRQLLLDSQGRGPLKITREAFRRKTGPNKRYPNTRIFRAFRLEQIQTRKQARPPRAPRAITDDAFAGVS